MEIIDQLLTPNASVSTLSTLSSFPKSIKRAYYIKYKKKSDECMNFQKRCYFNDSNVILNTCKHRFCTSNCNSRKVYTLRATQFALRTTITTVSLQMRSFTKQPVHAGIRLGHLEKDPKITNHAQRDMRRPHTFLSHVTTRCAYKVSKIPWTFTHSAYNQLQFLI